MKKILLGVMVILSLVSCGKVDETFQSEGQSQGGGNGVPSEQGSLIR